MGHSAHGGCFGVAVELAGEASAAPSTRFARVRRLRWDAEAGRDDSSEDHRRRHRRHRQVDEPAGRDRRRPPRPPPHGGPGDDSLEARTGAADAAPAGLPAPHRTDGAAERPRRARGVQHRPLRTDDRSPPEAVLLVPAAASFGASRSSTTSRSGTRPTRPPTGPKRTARRGTPRCLRAATTSCTTARGRSTSSARRLPATIRGASSSPWGTPIARADGRASSSTRSATTHTQRTPRSRPGSCTRART